MHKSDAGAREQVKQQDPNNVDALGVFMAASSSVISDSDSSGICHDIALVIIVFFLSTL